MKFKVLVTWINRGYAQHTYRCSSREAARQLYAVLGESKDVYLVEIRRGDVTVTERFGPWATKQGV